VVQEPPQGDVRRVEADAGPLPRKALEDVLEVVRLPADEMRQRGLEHEGETALPAEPPHPVEPADAELQPRRAIPDPALVLSTRMQHEERSAVPERQRLVCSSS